MTGATLLRHPQRLILAAAATVLFAGCTHTPTHWGTASGPLAQAHTIGKEDHAAATSFAVLAQDLPQLPINAHHSDVLAKLAKAIAFMQKMDLPQAQSSINAALQLDPRNAQLHFINGFIYHLQARHGDTQKGEMALEGYQQALRIDPGNWIAQEFQGLALLDLKRFEQAKLAFAEALLMTPQSAVSAHGLMVASYLTADPEVACLMADQFRKASTQVPPSFTRNSILVYAACGRFAQADAMRTAWLQQGSSQADMDRIDGRLAQWKLLFSQSQAAPIQTGLRSASEIDTPDAQTDPERSPVETTHTSHQQVASGGSAFAPSGPRMLLVDVVLLSTQELISTSKGVNLLNALTLQLGSVTGNVAAYSRAFSSNFTGSETPSTSTTITRAVTIPALSYSLNIANASNSINEVLARPTLAAMEDLPSEFFSGTNLSAGLVSTSQQGGTTIVPLEKRFGIKLAVTPKFLTQGQVQLKVEAQRTSLNTSIENPKAAYQVEIGETTANANVVMNMGQTLVLSGLSEKSTSNNRDGTPGLQDVPGLQYLFSNQKTNNLQRSVLILVTPRTSTPWQGSGMTDPGTHRMTLLRERYGLPSSTPTNTEAVLNQIKNNDFYREFRQSDVTMERWDRMHTTVDRLKQMLDFLYY